MPVVTLLVGWAFHVSSPSLTTLGNITGIVLGVVIASIGEVKFNIIGFAFQAGGILFEAVRLVIVEQLLSGSGFDHKMDPLVSLYYFAPVCAIMNAVVAYFTELPRITLTEIQDLGLFVLLLNGVVTFLLNVSSVILVSFTRAAYNALQFTNIK